MSSTFKNSRPKWRVMLRLNRPLIPTHVKQPTSLTSQCPHPKRLPFQKSKSRNQTDHFLFRYEHKLIATNFFSTCDQVSTMAVRFSAPRQHVVVWAQCPTVNQLAAVDHGTLNNRAIRVWNPRFKIWILAELNPLLTNPFHEQVSSRTDSNSNSIGYLGRPSYKHSGIDYTIFV